MPQFHSGQHGFTPATLWRLLRRWLRQKFSGEVIHREDRPFGQHHRPLDHIPQFAHIPRPRISLEAGHGFRGQVHHGFRYLAADFRQEMAHHLGNVIAPLAQRRHGDGNDIEPVIEILPERPFPDCRLQVAVRGRNHPDIDPDGDSPPDPHEFALLQDP